MKNLLSFLLMVLLMYACRPVDSELEPLPETVQGLRPVYATNDDWQNIRSAPPRPISLLGKIYYKDSVLYVSERNEGVHIIDNTDPLFPETIGFIEIPCNGDVAIKENMMYADNCMDLVVIDITDPLAINVVRRVKNIYSETFQLSPPEYTGSFECVQPENGIVIAWESAELNKPKCWQ